MVVMTFGHVLAFLQFDDISQYLSNVPTRSALITGSHISSCQTRRAQFGQFSQLVVSEVVVLLPGQRMAKSSTRCTNLRSIATTDEALKERS